MNVSIEGRFVPKCNEEAVFHQLAIWKANAENEEAGTQVRTQSLLKHSGAVKTLDLLGVDVPPELRLTTKKAPRLRPQSKAPHRKIDNYNIQLKEVSVNE